MVSLEHPTVTEDVSFELNKLLYTVLMIVYNKYLHVIITFITVSFM